MPELNGGSISNESSRLSVDEICRDLRIGRKLAYEMLQTRVIPNVKLGRGWLVTRHAYEAWKRTCGMHPEEVKSLNGYS